MDLITLGIIVLFIFVILTLIPVVYNIGKHNQKVKDISDMPILAGTIVIDATDPDGPYLFLDLDEQIDVIGTKEVVLCTVRTNGTPSRE